MSNKKEKRGKQIELGVIKRANQNSDPFIILDRNVLEVTIKRKTFSQGKEVEEIVNLIPTDSGSIIINTPTNEDHLGFKLKSEYITPDQYDTRLQSLEDKFISRILTVRVEPKE